MANLEELLAWADSHINYERMGPGASVNLADSDPSLRLANMQNLMAVLDDPQLLFPSIHLTGTNGKTSTARIITAILDAQGLTTGTYTSPHLERVNERIMTNGEPISNNDLADILESLKLIEPMVAEKPSYFELLTAAAYLYFADKPVHAGIIEVGMGGQWDATNVIEADVAVITNVGLDHMDYLGPTTADIATQKAGIVKPSSALVLGESDPLLQQIFEARPHGQTFKLDKDYGLDANAFAIGGRLLNMRTPKASYEGVFLSLHGSHQGANAANALMAVEAFFDTPVADDILRRALESVSSPGRMEIVHRQPLCIVDGAHNVDGARALVHSVDEEFGQETGRILVVGMLAPHDPAEMLAELGAKDARLVIACQPDGPRAIPAEDIATAAKSLGAATVVVNDIGQAVAEGLAAAGEDDVVLVTGSLYVVGAARAFAASLPL